MGFEGFSSSSTFTAGQGPIGRFFNSIVGVFIGILFIPGSFILVFFTESRRELAPIVRKKALPVEASASAQGLVKFTAKPEGTPVKEENLSDPLVLYSVVEETWRLGQRSAKEEEKVKNGNRTDTITRTLSYSDFSWVKGEETSKSMDSLTFNGLKADPRQATKVMGRKELYNQPSLKFLQTLEGAKQIKAGGRAADGAIVRIDDLTKAKWSGRETPSQEPLSGSGIKVEDVIAYRWRREITFANEKRPVKRYDWNATTFKRNGHTIAEGDALIYGWTEAYRRSAGSENVSGKSYDATEILEVVQPKGPLLIIGKMTSGQISPMVVSALDFDDTMKALKDTAHPSAGLHRVVVNGLLFGPPLFVVGDAGSGQIGRGPTDIFIVSGLSENDTVAELAREDAFIKWIGRIGGFLLLWFGMMMIGGPIMAFFEMVPLLGNFMGQATGCLMAILTLPLAAGLIILEVLLIKLWWALLAGLILIAIIGLVRHRSKVAPAAA